MIKYNKENIFIFSILIVLLIISLIIVKSFIIIIFFTFILTYIINPLYKKTLKIIKSKELVSITFSIILLFIIMVPISLMTLNLTKEINNINDKEIVDNLNIINQEINSKYQININFVKQYRYILNQTKKYLESYFLKVPSFLFQIFLIVFFYYYFSKDYNYEIRFFRKKYNPKKFKFIKEELDKLISGIIYGQIFVRMIQALVAILGFLIIGINGAIIAGILIFFAAFLPVIGTGIIWLPLAFISLLKHDYFISIMIIIIGIFISSIDNFLLPYIISEKTKIGPVLTLISILGGIELFGLYGIILGPFFIGILFILIEDQFEKIKAENPDINRFVWTEDERKKFKELKTDIAKDKFIEMLNKRKKSKLNLNLNKLPLNIQ